MDLLLALGFVSVGIVAGTTLRAWRRILHTGRVFAFVRQSTHTLWGILPERGNAWGTVYDADTKRPIAFATVRLLDEHRRVLETRITDHDGRYAFLTSPESFMEKKASVSLMVSASGYEFPSRREPTIDRFLYHALYRGGLLDIDHSTLLRFDIPVDPLKPSPAPLLVKAPSIAAGASIAGIADAAFWIGFIAVPMTFILRPNTFTFGFLCLYLGAASLRLSGVRERPFGLVLDAHAHTPIPYALLRLDDEHGKRIAFAVTDECGRYFMLAPKGRLKLSVATPADIQPGRQTHQLITAGHGWITMELAV